MPTPTKGPRLGGGPAHERLMLANLATSLFEHRRITTTEAKAKRLRPLAERMVTFAKRGDLHARRRVMTVIKDKGIVHVLFTEIAPLVAERPGGYTRITKIGPRKGDNAPMAVIELVLEPYSPKQATVKEAEAATKRSARGNTAAPVAVAAVPDEPAADAPADSTKPDVAADAGEGPYGADSAEPLEGGAAPDGFTIKGNRDSMKYHLPDGQWYDATIAEVWFSTEAAAVAAGFVPAGAAAKTAAADAD